MNWNTNASDVTHTKPNPAILVSVKEFIEDANAIAIVHLIAEPAHHYHRIANHA